MKRYPYPESNPYAPSLNGKLHERPRIRYRPWRFALVVGSLSAVGYCLGWYLGEIGIAACFIGSPIVGRLFAPFCLELRGGAR